MEISLRAAQENDLSDIIKLLIDLGYEADDSSAFRLIWEKIINDSKMGIVVAVFENKAVGYLAYSLRPQLRLVGELMEIDELCVGNKFRGFGIGSKLLSYTKKLALDKKVKRIILSTNRDRESYKRGFYLKYGFVEKNSAWMNLDL